MAEQQQQLGPRGLREMEILDCEVDARPPSSWLGWNMVAQKRKELKEQLIREGK